MSYCKIKKVDEEEGGGLGGGCDLNGNFYLPEDPKNCVLQILSDTLGKTPLSSPGSSIPFDQTQIVEQVECRKFPCSRTNFSSSLLNQPSVHHMIDEDENENENEIDFEIENDNDFDSEDVLAVPIVRCGSGSGPGNCKNSESSVSFNPGDTLSSPVPPLARPQTSPGNITSSRSTLSRTHVVGSKTNINRNTTSTCALNLNLSQNPERKSINSKLEINPLQEQQQISSTSNTVAPSLRHEFKKCHLSTVLGSARRCIRQLLFVKDGLASIVSADDQLSQGKKAPSSSKSQHHHPSTTDYALIATLGEYILNLTRSAFTPAHRLYTSALGLHMAEDLIRNPTDPALLNFKNGHIIRPSWNSIIHTQMKLRFCVDSATEAYHRFGRDANSSSNSTTLDFNGNGSACKSSTVRVEQMMQVMVTLMHAFQDLYATALGSNDIFKVLLHIEDYGEEILQEFLLSLESMERSELLVQVQALRRSFDDIVISMEQLSWAAYVVFRLASGKSLTPSPDGSMPASEQTSDTSTNDYTPNSDTTIPGGKSKSNPHRSSSSSSAAAAAARVKSHGPIPTNSNSNAHRNSSAKEKSSTEINPRKSSTSSVNMGGRSSNSSQSNSQHHHQTNGRSSSSSSSSRPKSGGKGQTQPQNSNSSYSNSHSHLNSKDGKNSVSSRVSETKTVAGKSRKVEDSDKNSKSRDKDKEKDRQRDRSKENHHHHHSHSHESTASRIPTPKNVSSTGRSTGSSRSKKGSSPTPSSCNSYSSTLSNHVKGHDSRKGITSSSSSSSNSGYRDKSRGEKERISKTEIKSKSSSSHSTSQKHGKSKSRSNSREKDKIKEKEHVSHRPSSSSSKTSHHGRNTAAPPPSSSGSKTSYGKSSKEKEGKEREKEKDRERHSHQSHSSSSSSSRPSSKQRSKLIVSDDQ